MTAPSQLESLKIELARLRGLEAIRRCVNRYMHFCDSLDSETRLNDLLELFTADAVWEGCGARYAKSLGRYEGRDQIGSMLRQYMTTPPHFAINAHFLCSEDIEVNIDANGANAVWMMLQTSTFASGLSHLNAARLTLRMVCDMGHWRIARFQTENLFSRPIDHWNSSAELPVPGPQAERSQK